MMGKFHFIGVTLAGILTCSVAQAQTHSGIVSPQVPSAHFRTIPRSIGPAGHAGTAPNSPARPASYLQMLPSGGMGSQLAPFGGGFSSDGYPVPGLGFDYPHLAAISGALGNSSFRFGHHDHHEGGAFWPIWLGGYPYYYYGDSDYDQSQQAAPAQPQQQQPQIIVIQQTVPTPGSAGSGYGNDGSNSTAPAPEAEAPAPVRDIGEFVLVRRDGRVLFASMFTVTGTQLTYVTPEGMRRTLALADLDADATQQMNEARGTTVQIHN